MLYIFDLCVSESHLVLHFVSYELKSSISIYITEKLKIQVKLTYNDIPVAIANRCHKIIDHNVILSQS